MNHYLGGIIRFNLMMISVMGAVVLFLPNYVSSSEVCYIHQSTVRQGVVKWVAPLDPCSCKETRTGGLNTVEEAEPPNGYLNDVLFTRDEERLRAWFGCPSMEVPTDAPLWPTDCADILASGINKSGLYTIYPHGTAPEVSVYCDMDTGVGGWTVFQRRQDGSVDFYRDWVTYRAGFGNMSGEFWLGNDNLRRLTGENKWELRVDLVAWDGVRAYSRYGSFEVKGEEYTLLVADKKPGGGAGDSLNLHNGSDFSTRDRDNDGYHVGSCAQSYQGAWWFFSSCLLSHLNGPYKENAEAVPGDGIGVVWTTFKNLDSLKESEMKIRKMP